MPQIVRSDETHRKALVIDQRVQRTQPEG